MRFLGSKKRGESVEQPPPAVLSAMTDEDSDYGPVPPPPALSQDEDDEMPGKNDPPQDVTQDMTFEHYHDDNDVELQQNEDDQQEGISHEYEPNEYMDDENASVEIPPTNVVQRMLDTDADHEKSTSGMPLLVAAACCFGILAIVLGTGFGTGAFLKENESSRSVSGGPAEGVDGVDQIERTSLFSTFLVTQSNDGEAIRNAGSPENKAMAWLAEEDPAQLDPTTDSQRVVQRYVLASLYFNSDSEWTNADGWLEGDDECEWFGVSCEEIDNNGASFNFVRTIDLHSNGLSGGLPVDLSLLKNLKYLYLGDNAIVQDISKLQWDEMIVEGISLFSNSISGDISSLGPLAETLRILDLSGNQLTGDFPDISALVNMEELYVEDNQYSGEIPDTLALLPLRILYIGDNDWAEAMIPPFLYTMTTLEVLSMPRCQRNQNIRGAIGNLANLAVLNLAENALTGNVPNRIFQIDTMTEFTAQGNQMDGPLPDFSVWGFLRTLNLANNDFTGLLPENIGNMANLRTLRLSRNLISGPIPASMPNLPTLEVLDLSRNRMTGELPINIGIMFNLRELDLSANLVPDVSGFSGELPPSLGNLRNLEQLKIRSNLFVGPIPTNFENLDAIQHVDLRFNGLIGDIPEEVSFWVDTATEVYFQGNRLTGDMPEGICGVPILETDCEMVCTCCTMDCGR